MRADNDATRLPVLDGLRGLAVLMVFGCHVKFTLDAQGKLLAEWGSLVERAFSAFAGPGWIGVELFFALSGFLITGILYDAKHRPHRFRNFYARRVLRIFPLYYGTLLLLLFVYPRLLPASTDAARQVWDHQAWYWSYLVNFAIALPTVDTPYMTGHFWSLAVEEHFYLLWPPIILLLSRRRAIAGCLALMLLSPALRLALTLHDATPWLTPHLTTIGRFNYCATPTRLDAIASGALAALLIRGPMGLGGCARWARHTMPYAGGVIFCIMALCRGHLSAHYPVTQVVGFSALGVFFTSGIVLMLSSDESSLARRLGESRVLRFLGRYSYAIYVFQLTPLTLLVPVLFPDGTLEMLGSHLLGLAVYALLGLGVTLVMALCSWHLMEKHFLRLKRWF